MKTMTQGEFLDQLRAQDVGREHAAVVCPMCGTVQSPATLIRAGAGDTFAAVGKYIGFSCVGRWRTPRLSPSEARASGQACTWTLGGFFQTHNLEIIGDDGVSFPYFEPATPEQAQELKARHNAQ